MDKGMDEGKMEWFIIIEIDMLQAHSDFGPIVIGLGRCEDALNYSSGSEKARAYSDRLNE